MFYENARPTKWVGRGVTKPVTGEVGVAHFFFLSGAWVSTEAARVFATFDEFGLLNTLAAREATDFELCSFSFGICG